MIHLILLPISMIMVGVGAYIMGKFGERRRVLLLIKKIVWDDRFNKEALHAINNLIDSIQP